MSEYTEDIESRNADLLWVLVSVRNFFKEDTDKAVAWFLADSPMCGGKSPLALILLGRRAELRRIVADALERNCL